VRAGLVVTIHHPVQLYLQPISASEVGIMKLYATLEQVLTCHNEHHYAKHWAWQKVKPGILGM
jgi:hypothetical protein